MDKSRSRRHFIQDSALALTAAAAALNASTSRSAAADPTRARLKLGYDNFAVRAMKWKAEALIDYAEQLQVDSLFITDLDAFVSRETAALQELRRKATDKGIDIQLGTWSICPTSKTFRNNNGTAEEHLALGLRMARDLGSPVLRVILGSGEDRKTPGGIEARMADTVKVCQAMKSRATDYGVKIAVENHAGDMHSRELVTLVEAAGKDFVGVNIDPGNACWTLEDPLENLENLGPYTLTSSMRDSMVWEYPDGAKVQWTAMGEGVVDFKTYFKRFAELCPKAPVHIETISGFAREFPYLKPSMWQGFSGMRAADFSRFVALAKRGRPIEPNRSPNEQAEQSYQKGEIERSIRYCKTVLGLGLKT
ncbi:MAG: sugar phosphate isomerase/epimerase [Verrucomicrobia bacterium]|nr:sugar phosphate isomerase/epimerase [Verrucomicrobiota bacterium]